MSDFVVWMSSLAVPEEIRRRWKWSASGRLGVRRQDFSGLALVEASGEGGEIAVIGHSVGRRGARALIEADDLAHRLLREVDSQGVEALDQYLGPFAGAALYDRGRRVLVWRDRFGRHPIQMIRLLQGWVLTTSPELAALLVEHRPHWVNLAAFVHGDADTTDADVLADIFRIRPGEAIIFDRGRPTQRIDWWRPTSQKVEHPQAQMATLLYSMGEFFGRRPHILALSAGLDSSTLAAFISSGHPGTEAVTFTDPQSPWDEAREAAGVAQHLKLRWRPFYVTEHWPLSRIEDHRFPLAWGPSAHPDMAWKLPFHRWLRNRRGDLPLMYGNGSDEVLWYPSRLWLQGRWARGDWSEIAEAFRHLPLERWAGPGFSAAIDALGLRPFRSLLPRWSQEIPTWQDSSRWIRTEPDYPALPECTDPGEQFFRLRLRRLKTWSWERVMRSLAWESRRANRSIWTPFLDAEFWELSLNLSPTHLVEEGRQKAILRRVSQDLLPERCRHRPKVGGFDPLVERGLVQGAPWRVYSLFSAPRLGSWPAFDGEAFLKAYEAYRQANDQGQCRSYRGSWAIWRTIATELWLRRIKESPGPFFRESGGR